MKNALRPGPHRMRELEIAAKMAHAVDMRELRVALAYEPASVLYLPALHAVTVAKRPPAELPRIRQGAR